MQTVQLKYPIFNKLVTSSYLDFFAVIIILTTSLLLNYHKTFYFDGTPQFNIPVSQWGTFLKQGAFPLGIFSIIVACFSMLSTRFLGKEKNIGNKIAIGTTICVCVIDFLLGNKSAVITYPLTFVIHSFATVKWSKGEQVKPKDTLYYIIFVVGIILGYALVFLGFYIFDQTMEWYNDSKSKLLFHSISITFGISLAANTANAFKYQETWINWLIYNIIQLIKNVLLLNWANVGKYIFYIFNSIITFVDWKFNKRKSHASDP